MSKPDGLAFGEAINEADAAEQRIPVDPGDEATWQDTAAVSAARMFDADEADLIDQAIEVPIPDDEPDLE